MRKGLIGGFLAAIVIIVALFSAVLCLERIPTGYVGVVYSMNGGVQEEVLTQGWHLVAPTKKVKEFTIGNEQLVLSKDARDGSEGDDSFSVATADNANIDISFQMSGGVVLIAVLFCFFIGIVFGLYPANKAARMAPIDALHYGG